MNIRGFHIGIDRHVFLHFTDVWFWWFREPSGTPCSTPLVLERDIFVHQRGSGYTTGSISRVDGFSKEFR